MTSKLSKSERVFSKLQLNDDAATRSTMTENRLAALLLLPAMPP